MRGRRPVAAVREDVLGTASALLADVGLAGLTIERLARDSGVSKTTIYKHWPSVGALALDAYFHSVEDVLAFPDTGDIRADLRAQLREFIRLMRGPAGRLVAELIGRAQLDPELAVAYRERYSAERRRIAVGRMRAARDLGQLRPDLDLETVIDQLWGAVYHRLLIPDQPLTEPLADLLVDNLFDSIAG